MWLFWVLLLHICISAYCYSVLCSSVCFSQTEVSKVREGAHRLTVITVVLLGSYFGAHKYWVMNLSLKHQKESREKNCCAFYFSPIRTDSEKGFAFLNCHTGLAWASWSELLNKSDTPASCRGCPKEWEVRKLNMTFYSEPTYGFI